jgi:hypothetical protein
VVSRAVSSLVLFPGRGEDCIGALVERPRLLVPINELSSGIVKLKRWVVVGGANVELTISTTERQQFSCAPL